MKAAVANNYDGPSQLKMMDIDQPEPSEGQILIEVHAASVNPFDLKLINGSLRDILPLKFPYVVGMDVSGVVSKVGTNETKFQVGDKVFGMLRETAGSFAEYVVAKGG